MSRALIVDFGGVLTTNVFESFRAFADAEGLDRDAVKTIFRERGEGLDLLRQLERGELEIPEFEEKFGPLLGVRETSGMVERLFAGVQADDAMVEAVRRAKGSGIATGLISNSWGGTSYDRVRDPAELFDTMVISGEVGLHKPEPEIFRLGAERLGVEPDACVFVDDLRENCEGAEAVGMTAILHRGADQTIPELERLLGLELR
ncbi:MAG: putative hydrolase of the superfamily [Thermoleophilaceae bacterium]|nr:putative hydrolase of the superfamily [Thermoleophilaceae bacterium]